MEVSLKILNQAEVFSVCLKTIGALNLKLLCIQHVLSFEFQKVRILEILNFHPCSVIYIHYAIFFTGV